MTVVQEEQFSLPKSCIQVEEIGAWPCVPKKNLAPFLMAIPTQQRWGERDAAEEGLQEET